jgi:small-conductance mechanosensitive channel
MVLSGHIVNYSSSSQEPGLILHTGVTIGYDAPWRHVHALLIAAAYDTEHILKEPKPFVLQTSLDDFYVSYELNAFTNQPLQMARIYSELHSRPLFFPQSRRRNARHSKIRCASACAL